MAFFLERAYLRCVQRGHVCVVSDGTFSFHRANARSRFIDPIHVGASLCKCTFAFDQAKVRSHFIVRMHVFVLSSKCTFAFNLLQVHGRVRSSEGSFAFHRASACFRSIVQIYVSFYPATARSRFFVRRRVYILSTKGTLGFHRANARFRLIQRRHVRVSSFKCMVAFDRAKASVRVRVRIHVRFFFVLSKGTFAF